MYDYKKIEQKIAELWEKKKIYKKAKEKNKNGKKFYFCDGPPYATGQIHPGTAWNKTIKDTVCRYWRMNSYDVRAQPGFDTHGLPIEVKVEQEMKIKNKIEIEEKVGIEKFIQKCKEFATKYIGVMSDQFKSVGVWMDFERPYITYEDDYIEKSWKTLKHAWEQNLMHEGVYVLPYCYRCETTIANYELEYSDESDPSVYVKFKLKGADNEYLIIWTTTPWTLVANMGVMVHPTLQYVKVKVDDEVWIIAKDRLEAVLSLVEKSGTVLDEVSGKKLEGRFYEHPFQDKINKKYERKILLSDEYVTTEDGSGLVHCAPGHGPEDFIIGKRYGIEPFCPVDGHGNYTPEAGSMFEGKNVKKMNPEIITLLENYGILLNQSRVKHRYPHCWRCKTPLIFITTKQWFIAISKIKDRMLAEIDKTEWYPDFAKARFREFVTTAPDWCISRQRYWGIPLPIWRCTDRKCGKVKVIGSKKEVGKIRELHRPYIDKIEFKCECGQKMTRIPDVLDVWFDSGNAIWASLSEEEAKEFGERADMIIEGQDQIRGWFYSLLGSGVIKYGACPYKKILMHGFFVDEKGEKMSKSVGNFVPLEDILAKYGADTFRLWGMSNTVWEELKFNWEDLKKANGDINIMVNLVTFLERFYHTKKIPAPKELAYEDLWMISRTNSTVKEFRETFEKYEINKSVKALRAFIVDDLSRYYMKIAKDRIGRESNGNAALFTLYYSVYSALRMMSVLTPFSADYLYQKFFAKYEKEESIMLIGMPQADEGKIAINSEKQMELVKTIISTALLARQRTSIKLRWPMKYLYVETRSRELVEAVEAFKDSITRLTNVKEVKIVTEKPKEDVESQEFDNGIIHVQKKIDEELYEEGITNEVKRRIQNLRKETKLVERNQIEVYLKGEDETIAIVDKNRDKIARDVNAKKIVLEEGKEMQEFDIDGRIIRIGIKKIGR